MNQDKFLELSWSELGVLIGELANKILNSEKKFDLVIGIARGGLPASMVIADQLGAHWDALNIKSYKGIERVKLPEIVTTVSEDIAGKRVLLVDDLVDTGDTMATVIEHLKLLGAGEVIVAVLFIKTWSKKRPDFWLRETDKFIVFPWEQNEIKKTAS